MDLVTDIKVVLVGDAMNGLKRRLMANFVQQMQHSSDGSGKTGISSSPSFSENNFEVIRADRKFGIGICDTTGQEDYERLRHLSYHDTDVFVLCFDIGQPLSFERIRSTWHPDVSRFCRKRQSPPCVLLGLEPQIRGIALPLDEDQPISIQQASDLATELGIHGYVEVSLSSPEGLDHSRLAELVVECALKDAELLKNEEIGTSSKIQRPATSRQHKNKFGMWFQAKMNSVFRNKLVLMRQQEHKSNDEFYSALFNPKSCVPPQTTAASASASASASLASAGTPTTPTPTQSISDAPSISNQSAKSSQMTPRSTRATSQTTSPKLQQLSIEEKLQWMETGTNSPALNSMIEMQESSSNSFPSTPSSNDANVVPIEDWSKEDVARWLEAVGLGQYAPRFTEHDICGVDLRDLSDTDLKTELHLSSLGHRMKFRRALETLLR